ncbi:unnamed protein product [Rhizophagus irregularis]|nr:unnamed protein product [Rhizophagus irregularis]
MNYGEYEINKQIEEADKINASSSLNPDITLSYTTTNSQSSRLLDFKNLPEPKDAIDSEDDDKSFDCSEFVEPIDFTEQLDENN